MRRTFGCFSVVGVLVALAVVAVVAVLTALWGPVLFSPGPLTARGSASSSLQGYGSHAEMESECTLCHRPWRRVEATRCLLCHEQVQAEASAGKGLHGLLSSLETCTECHTDHKGRAYDIAPAQGITYPHKRTGFILLRHQQLPGGEPFSCLECHPSGYGPPEPSVCASCHAELDPVFQAIHRARYGSGCMFCHDGTALPEPFEHSRVLELDGAHAGIDCAGCHNGDLARALELGCIACHEAPAVHGLRFGASCAACHAVQGWQPASLRYHSFPLDHGETEDGSCLTCHPDGYASYSCAACHEHEPSATERQHRRVKERLDDCARCHPLGEAGSR